MYDEVRPAPPSTRSSHSKHRKETERLSQTFDNRAQNSFQLSSQQNETIDNLVQKLEDHIATELDRFDFLQLFEKTKEMVLSFL